MIGRVLVGMRSRMIGRGWVRIMRMIGMGLVGRMIMRGWMGMRMMIGIIVFEGGDGWRWKKGGLEDLREMNEAE